MNIKDKAFVYQGKFLCASFIAPRYKKEIYELVKKRTEEADNVNEVYNHLVCIS